MAESLPIVSFAALVAALAGIAPALRRAFGSPKPGSFLSSEMRAELTLLAYFLAVIFGVTSLVRAAFVTLG